MFLQVTMPRQIKLMWDYECWPLWQHDGEIFDTVDPSSFPLSEQTLARLAAWASIPDKKLTEVEYPPDMTWTEDEKKRFEQEGLDLWKALRHELGRNYYVTYHSKAKGRVLLPEDESA